MLLQTCANVKGTLSVFFSPFRCTISSSLIDDLGPGEKNASKEVNNILKPPARTVQRNASGRGHPFRWRTPGLLPNVHQHTRLQHRQNCLLNLSISLRPVHCITRLRQMAAQMNVGEEFSDSCSQRPAHPISTSVIDLDGLSKGTRMHETPMAHISPPIVSWLLTDRYSLSRHALIQVCPADDLSIFNIRSSTSFCSLLANLEGFAGAGANLGMCYRSNRLW